MAGLVEHVRVDVERRARTGVPHQPADLHDVQAQIDDQVAGKGVA